MNIENHFFFEVRKGKNEKKIKKKKKKMVKGEKEEREGNKEKKEPKRRIKRASFFQHMSCLHFFLVF